MKASLRNLLIVSLLAFLGCRSTPAFNFGAYSEAERFYEKKEYEKAIAKYDQYIKENPEGNMAVIAHYYMAKSHEELGQPDPASTLYEKIIQDHPDLIWADFSKARLEELRGESEPIPPAPAATAVSSPAPEPMSSAPAASQAAS
jgi:tetratricopeptide (TPR) repeat protein